MTDQVEPIRSFVAIELSEEVRAELERLQSLLRDHLGRSAGAVRWARPEGSHLTLQFLGDIHPDSIGEIKRMLAVAAEDVHPFMLHLGEVGTFPNVGRPRVIWVGLDGTRQALHALHGLQKAVATELDALGYRPDKSFNPHLTLGRVRETARRDDLATISSVIDSISEGYVKPASFRVAGLSLMRSDLQPAGPIYTQLAHVSLRS